MLQETEPKIQRMEYRRLATVLPALAQGEIPAAAAEASAAAGEAQRAMLQARIEELERQALEREQTVSVQIDAARREALEQGRIEAESRRMQANRSAAEQIHAVLSRFAEEREQYFAQVESEVVRLALGIAARILRREAQMDPLLLSGAVRVALGQLAEGTTARLRVPAREQELWAEMLRLMPNLPLRPELIADATLAEENCVLETDLGTIDLGVRAQLKEIERGFFDLLDCRPGEHARSAEEADTVTGLRDEESARRG